MLNTTLPRLRCPSCVARLDLEDAKVLNRKDGDVFEITSGTLHCKECKEFYPIIGGVAILVEDVQSYFLDHVKGIARNIPDTEIPEWIREPYLEAKSELTPEHIEEDLEAERVNALYFMNHYLSASLREGDPWWGPHPLMDSLIRQYWDQGPLSQIKKWIGDLPESTPGQSTIELGCGVAGLAQGFNSGGNHSYLGLDSSFASIALGRHLILGVPHSGKLLIPADLIQGPVSRSVQIPVPKTFDGSTDLIVSDFESPPVAPEEFDIAITLNAMDMMDDPEHLPQLHHRLLKPKGISIQSCPYIWHENVARSLRERLPESAQTSSSLAAEWLYEQSGFNIEERRDSIPWLFFKHFRQLEIYFVHLFRARKR